MKLQGRAIETFVRSPDPKIRVALVYGPDTGLVRQRALTIGKTVVQDMDDPFRVAGLTADAVVQDPVLLADEAAAQSLTGGRRLIRIRDAEERLAKALGGYLDAPAPGDSLILLEAGELGPRSKLRTLCEQSPVAAALPCYVETEGNLANVLQDRITGKGYRIDRDALSYLASCLVGDRLLAIGEVDKLLLYMGDQKAIDLDDARAVVGDAAAIGLEEPAIAAASGDAVAVDRSLGRLFGEGESPVGVLRAAQRHFQRLHWVRAQMATGMAAPAAVGSLKPPPFFKLRDAMIAQVQRWPLERLGQALARLQAAEIACKAAGPDEDLCARALLGLAAAERK